MNKEEIENRIIACEMKANAYREAGNTKTANRYDNERYRWEKLLSDLELLNEIKIKELLDYKRGYFDLQQKNKQLKEEIKDYKYKLSFYCSEETYIKQIDELKEVIDRAIEYLETKRIREKAIVDADVLEGILNEVE